MFSSFVAVKAVLRDYCALFTHFTECSSTDNSRSSKERSKYSGLAKNYSHGFLLVKHACSKMHCDASVVVFAKY